MDAASVRAKLAGVRHESGEGFFTGFFGRGGVSSDSASAAPSESKLLPPKWSPAGIVDGMAPTESPDRVTLLSPDGAIAPTGPWSVGARAGDFVFVAGMRGIDPATGQLVEGDEARIRRAFLNMKLIAESEGARLSDAVRLVVYVTDMARLRPLANKVQEELWAGRAGPPRTIVEVARLNQDDIFEVEATFYAPR